MEDSKSTAVEREEPVGRSSPGGWPTRHAWVPIPLLAVLIAVIYFTIDPLIFYDPPWLILIGNTLLVTVVCLVVSFIAMRNYLSTGRIQVLLLGCGVLVFGIGGAVAAAVRGLPDGANLNVTVYNTGALFGATFHFVAAFILLTGISMEIGASRRKMWLALGYTGVSLFMAAFTVAGLEHLVPPFFIQRIGPTALRQAVLGAAMLLFAFSFVVFLGMYVRLKEIFLYWYSCALALTAISLSAFFIESSIGSPIGWAGRVAQYMGGVYFLAALITAASGARTRRMPFDFVLTTSLAGAESWLRTVLESIGDGFFAVDADWRFIYINAPAEGMLGIRREDVLGKSHWDVFPLTSGTRLEQEYRRTATGEIRDFENFYEPWSRWFHHRCFPSEGGGLSVFFEDITERKRADKALERHSAVLAGINRVLALGLGDESEEQLCEACLAAAEEITGSRISFVGEIGADGFLHSLAISNPGWEACRMRDRAGHRKPPVGFPDHGIYGRVVSDGKSLIVNDPATHPDRIGLPEGHPPLVSFLGVPLVRDSKTAGMIAVGNREGGYGVEDQQALEAVAPAIVEALDRKRAEQALRRAKDELEERVRQRTAELHRRAEQLARLTSELTMAEQRERQHLAQVLHDGLQQLLVAARFRLNVLETSTEEQVRGEAAELSELIADSIETSRSLTAELSPPVLKNGLVPSLEWLARWMHEKHGLVIDLETPVGAAPMAENVTVLLFQATRELLFNVVKHAGVKAARVILSRDDRRLVVVVEDEGRGFEPERPPTGGDQSGGLGLFAIGERLELLGGSLRIDSAPGRGSRLTLVVPDVLEASVTSPPRAPQTQISVGFASPAVPSEAEADGQVRIALVDDHAVVRQGLAAVLRQEKGFQIVGEASDGKSAVELVHQLQPDVVLMDISMPGMNGIEATKIIHEESPDVRVIGLSMHDDAHAGEEMRAAGAAAYLSKSGPVDSIIQAILESRPSSSGRCSHGSR